MNVVFFSRKGSRPSLVIKEQSRNVTPPHPVAEQKHPEIEQKLQWNNEPSLNFMAMHPPFSLRLLPLLLIDVFWTSTQEGSLLQQLMIDGSEGALWRSEKSVQHFRCTIGLSPSFISCVPSCNSVSANTASMLPNISSILIVETFVKSTLLPFNALCMRSFVLMV